MKEFAGYALIVTAVLLALFAFGTAVLDTIWAALIQPNSPGLAGFKLGSLIGVILRTLILGGIALALFRWGRSLINPAKYSKPVLEAGRLRKIYARERLGDRTFPSVVDEFNYEERSDADLASVYRAIDRQKVPDTFDALLAAIKTRVEETPQHGCGEARLP